jgi:hypothetical protein
LPGEVVSNYYETLFYALCGRLTEFLQSSCESLSYEAKVINEDIFQFQFFLERRKWLRVRRPRHGTHESTSMLIETFPFITRNYYFPTLSFKCWRGEISFMFSLSIQLMGDDLLEYSRWLKDINRVALYCSC